jgi:ketosteroid isomerase-like protein
MSAQENKALVLRLVEEFRRGNLAFVDEVFSPSVRLITPSPDWVFPDGLEGPRMMFGLIHEMGAEMKIEDIIAEDDTVAVRWTLTGVYRGEPKPGFPKPGEKMTSGSASFFRFVDGKIDRDCGLDIISPTHDPWRSN